jgi:type II secretory pathway component PulM
MSRKRSQKATEEKREEVAAVSPEAIAAEEVAAEPSAPTPTADPTRQAIIGKLERSNIGLPVDLHRTAVASCKLLGISLSDAIAEALVPWLAANREEVRKRSVALMKFMGED